MIGNDNKIILLKYDNILQFKCKNYDIKIEIC